MIFLCSCVNASHLAHGITTFIFAKMCLNNCKYEFLLWLSSLQDCAIVFWGLSSSDVFCFVCSKQSISRLFLYCSRYLNCQCGFCLFVFVAVTSL